ncbi:MAG: transposase, partial [Prolixibacteraceae bacterium]|nr:transposase [Prolixibacteraceae bacterium]
MLESFKQRFKLDKPIIVADSGLLSKNNIESLIAKQYTFILGARIKNEAYAVVSQIEKLNLKNGETTEISKGERLRLIISFPDKRATK